MVRITIVAVGKLKETYLKLGMKEYLKRLAPWAKIDIKELREESFPPTVSRPEREGILTKEGERIISHIPPGSHIFLLDVAGELVSSEELAAKLSGLSAFGNSFTFIIGGPLGVSAKLKTIAHERISLSPLTFTHQMTRLILIEQIYRSFKINRREKYHW